MIYVFLSVLASTLILAIFRLMTSVGANTRHTITVSYLVASLTGFTQFSTESINSSAPWFWPAAAEGAIFYLVFRLMAKTTQVNGIAVASIATKMSVVIPVCIGIVVLNESANAIKLAGVFAGICAVFLSAGGSVQVNQWKWPALVFLGTGAIDASFKLFQELGLSEQEFPLFITTIFSFAFVVGLVHHFVCADRRLNSASVFSGIALGLTNFGTVFFILKALAQPQWESSVIFPINNFGVVALSTVTAVVLFNEKLSSGGWAGLGLAVAAIGLLYLGAKPL